MRLLLALIVLFSACEPIPKAEGDRILASYEAFRHEVVGVPVRQIR